MTEIVQTVLQNTEPLQHPRNDRLPLYVWPLTGVGTDDETDITRILTALNDRGIALVAAWNHNRESRSLAEGLRIASGQKKLGLRVNINANALLHRFCNGDLETAHITDTGEPFFDTSFSRNVNIGCPFALAGRYPEIRSRVETFARAYQAAGIDVDVVFTDWEIDGPIEWNGAWAAAKKCRRCREHIPNLDDFAAFQTAYRAIRSDIQKTTYADVLKARFPNVLVGNYAVYPHNGERYWYDYFETLPDGAPYRADQRAKYRPWVHEFSGTGYTLAMPVVYTWYATFTWYDFQHSDYRWFYNMLLVASNAAEHTPSHIPLLPFVHWHTTSLPKTPDPAVRQFSAQMYQELLWHMLLRGHNTFFLWCPRDETAGEVRLVHQVYAAAQAYGEFLDEGEPITFSVPSEEGPVVSALRLDNRLLVRRTDFTARTAPVSLPVDNQTVQIPRREGQCQIITLK